MAKIQQGDYLTASPNVANKNYIGEMTNALGGAVENSFTIANKANESKLASNQIELANRALKLNNDINIKYQADPTNPEREREFREQFDMIASEYKVNPLVEGKWGQIKENVYNNFSSYNAKWQLQQQQTNAQNDLKKGYEELNNQISMLGQNGASYDEIRLVYENGISGLKNASYANLGEVVTENFLKDANHDFMATYISSLAQNNALKAQELMKDKGVLEDIGNAQTIEKLNDYISTALLNQHKKTAVAELGNALRAMSSDEANILLDGKANINQLMKFNENFKNIPEESKDLLNSIYGIRTQNKYIYNSDTKRIERAKEGESLGNLKLTDVQKRVMADELETDLQELLFNPEDVINVTDLKSTEQKELAQDKQIGIMKQIASMQGRIDTAYASGAIDKNTRNRYMQDYIAPVSDYLEKNLEQLDQGALGKGLLGYDRIKKEFDTTDLDRIKLQEVQQQKLMAQTYYLDELHKVVQKTPGLNSIYDIETRLSKDRQKEVYQIATDNALLRAKRWTSKPEVYFAKEFPAEYELPFKIFGQEKAMQINREVASQVYKLMYEADGREKNIKDIVSEECFKAIKREAMRKSRQAGEMLLDRENTITAKLPRTYKELEKELAKYNYTVDEFAEFAYQGGYVPKRNVMQLGEYFSKEYMQALMDIRQAKTRQAKRMGM